jgi:hypothetical protein
VISILDELQRIRRAWAHRLFDGPLPLLEMAMVIAFAIASVSELYAVAALAFAVFVLVFIFAVAERRVIDIVLLAGVYYVFRFNLIEAVPPYRYLTDVISIVSALGVLTLLVTRKGRLRWYDGLFAAWGAYALVLALARDVPLTPAIVQIRAMLGVYPLFVLVREIGFEGTASRHRAALTFYGFFAWALFLQAFVEKVSGKLVLTTAFVKWTSISYTNWPRVYGWTANPNSLGALCVLLIALGILLAAWGHRGRWLNTGLALYFGTLVLSVSRSAMWGLIVFLAVVLFQHTFEGMGRREIVRFVVRPFAVGLAVAFLAILLSIAIPALSQSLDTRDDGFGVFGRFVTGGEEVDSSRRGGRIFSLTTGLAIATRGAGDMLFGQGPATYGSAGSNFWESPLYDAYGIPENFYADMFPVMMLVEVGIIGLLMYVAGLVGLARANSGMPLTWRLGIGALLALWCLFYNVPEITMLYFPILVFLGVPMSRPGRDEMSAILHAGDQGPSQGAG